jgi:molybdopterin-guanine dinucleotide biosynthesis protein A
VPRFPQIEGFVLAGGKSSRMGRDKALLEVAGKPLVKRAAELLEPLTASVTLIGEPQRYSHLGFPVLADRWPGEGPLGGIVTALEASRSPWCLILACDMPFLTPEWLAWLCERTVALGNTGSADAVVPESARGLEPMCAAYRTTCAVPLAAAFESGVRKVTGAIAGLELERIPETEWHKFSPDRSLFRNLNTREDYRAARNQLDPRNS